MHSRSEMTMIRRKATVAGKAACEMTEHDEAVLKGVSTEKPDAAVLEQIRQEAAGAAEEVVRAGKLGPGDLFVTGCSSSEAAGHRIGTFSSYDIAEAIFSGIEGVLTDRGIFLAAQCCEHLNRALIVEREAAEKYRMEIVNAVPRPKAGGSFATAAYRNMKDPVAVESLQAQASAGLDIGDTLIGMHIHPVVVPLRISVKQIGEAHVVAARRRPKFVGGDRAVYDEKLM